MQALPLYLDKLFHPVVAVILSVTFVLAFGEVHFVFPSAFARCSLLRLTPDVYGSTDNPSSGML